MAANAYMQGWREWDERYADLVIGKRNWQLAAGGLLIVSIILAAGMVWLSGHSRYIVYAVQVDKLGLRAHTSTATHAGGGAGRNRADRAL
jgi:type IV secretion system protein VirB5